MKRIDKKVLAINNTIVDLEPDEIEAIKGILEFHAYEPSAAAEKIAALLSESTGESVTKKEIFDLL